MNLHQLISTIVDSSEKDWNYIYCSGFGSVPSYPHHPTVRARDSDGNGLNTPRETSHSQVVIYIPNVAITMAFGLSFRENFQEPWANTFPDPQASGSYADVFYNGSLVHRVLYVTVDGGRTKLPLPTSREKPYLVPWAYAKFIRLLDTIGRISNFNDYFKRAGLQTVDTPWPDFEQ